MTGKSTALLPKLFVGLLLAGTLASCALNPEGLHHGASQNNDIEIYGATAGIRGIILRKKSSEVTYCAEPQPDAAVSESVSENIGASQGAADSEKEGVSESEGETSLDSRSANVLISREILYRTCEFISNSNLSEEAKIALFNASLQQVTKINRTNLGKGASAQTPNQDMAQPEENTARETDRASGDTNTDYDSQDTEDTGDLSAD
jgi:hypothetical protein